MFWGGRFKVSQALAQFIKIKETLRKAVEDLKEERCEEVERKLEIDAAISDIDTHISMAQKAIKGLEQIV